MDVIAFPVRNELHGHTVAAGASTGSLHAQKIVSQFADLEDDGLGVRVVFDFDGIEIASASYIKASILWLTTCGRMHAGIMNPEELRTLETTHFKPLNVFPVVANANSEIQTELQEVFAGRGLACVITTEWSRTEISAGKVLGRLEPTATRTLKALVGMGEFTAYDLQERFPKDSVNTTAWNNRLVELYRLRILRRRKQGKFWKYQTVADQLTYG
jgi:hypothetical protein